MRTGAPKRGPGRRRAPTPPQGRFAAPGFPAPGVCESRVGGCRSIRGSMLDRRHPVVRGPRSPRSLWPPCCWWCGGAVWWRLASGPIMLDLATPWLTSAIEQNCGSRYRVEVGGTQLERDAQGRTALRLRDIVLRDTSGVTVAVAPKAEVGISGTSLLIASPRAESFRLVDANMTIRIDPDGRVNVLVGGERPFVTIAPEREAQLNSRSSAERAARRPSIPERRRRTMRPLFSLQALTQRSMATNVAALLAWIDELGKLGLDAGTGGFDGQVLNEIGIANGSLTIDDRRSGTEWKLRQISLNLNRPRPAEWRSPSCRKARSGPGC